MPIEIRRLTREDDLGAVAAIQSASHEASTWNPADYFDYDTFLAFQIGDPRPVGFLVMRTLAPGEHELLNLAVAPELRRKKVASDLLRYAMEYAPGVWFLEVRDSNEAAQKLYKSFGFTTSGKRKKYYQKPEEDAIVMSCRS